MTFGVALSRVRRTGILNCKLQCCQLAVVVLARRRREQQACLSKFRSFPGELDVQIVECPTYHFQMVEKEVGQITLVLP